MDPRAVTQRPGFSQKSAADPNGRASVPKRERPCQSAGVRAKAQASVARRERPCHSAGVRRKARASVPPRRRPSQGESVRATTAGVRRKARASLTGRGRPSQSAGVPDRARASVAKRGRARNRARIRAIPPAWLPSPLLPCQRGAAGGKDWRAVRAGLPAPHEPSTRRTPEAAGSRAPVAHDGFSVTSERARAYSRQPPRIAGRRSACYPVREAPFGPHEPRRRRKI